MPNPERKYALISLVVAAAAGILVFMPGWLGVDGMDGGYAISFVAAWIAISGLVIAWFFWRRAARLDELLKGQDLIAHWTYTPAEWQAYAGTELRQQTRENTGLLILMAVMCLVMGVFFWALDPEAGFFVFLAMVALIIILALAAFGIPHLTRLRREHAPGEAWISDRAVYFDGVYYPFKSGLMRLTGVELAQDEDSTISCLHFHIYHIAYAGIQSRTLRVPVPIGYKEEAQTLLEHFTSTSKKKQQ